MDYVIAELVACPSNRHCLREFGGDKVRGSGTSKKKKSRGRTLIHHQNIGCGKEKFTTHKDHVRRDG